MGSADQQLADRGTRVHRIAVTQKRCNPNARAYLQRRTTAGDTPTEALRALKRRLSDIVYRMLLADSEDTVSVTFGQAA